MIRLLPFIAIAILILGGLFYWRFAATKQITNPDTSQTEGPIEVPKTLPQATLEDRVKSLEDLASKLVTEVNSLKSGANKTQSNSSTEDRLNSLDAAATELKARISALEKVTSAPGVSSSGKSTIYIPLGSGGQISDTNWVSLNTFQINLDPAQYSGYSNMQLEVNMRLNQPGGKLYARLYNVTGGSATSSEISTDTTNSTVVSSSGFTLPSGSKTYVLQAKTSDGTLGFLDYARIRVNF